MKLHLVPTGLALHLAFCGADSSADVDTRRLLQTGNFTEAAQITGHRLVAVAKGTAEEQVLILDNTEALSFTDGEKAQDCFLGFATDNPELVTLRDFSYVIACLRTNERCLEAIEFIHHGLARWPEDPTLESLQWTLLRDASRADGETSLESLHGLFPCCS